MKLLPVLLLLSTCAGAPIAPVYAAESCRPITELIEIAAKQHWENVVVRGPAIAKWVEIADSLNIEILPDFVMIQFAPGEKAAKIWFGKGDELCDPIIGPIDDIKRLLGMA